MNELKACPFCGREAEVIKQYKSSNPGNFEDMHYQVKCTYCSAQSGWADDVQFIVEWWNGKYNNALQSELDKVIDAERKKSLLADERGVELDTLKQSVKDAVEEIELEWLHGVAGADGNRDDVYQSGAGKVLDILRKHGLVEDK